jgi:hypothetical protein
LLPSAATAGTWLAARLTAPARPRDEGSNTVDLGWGDDLL